MLEIKNLNKYYNKNKRNELHVLKDISIVLPNSGLISIVGESGSGKTTLLQAIGGLDSYKGSISYDGKSYKGYNLDLYRQDNIGIIFQNYLLFEDLTIYENLAICLRVIGIKDKDEVDKRISYVLEQVGMFKMRKKLAKNLSGGQQQRVSIARALIKNTKILLADEPTGNLDRKNTIEIMNILKKISKTTLVLLVTHNREMANLYSDQIINIKDGNLVDEEVSKSNSFSNLNDDIIYLEDYNKESLDFKTNTIDLYGDIKDINLKVILKEGRYYLLANKDINIVKKENVKEKREVFKLEDIETNFDNSFYENKRSSRTLATFKEILINFFSRKRKRDKLLNFSFFGLGMILGLTMVLLFSYVLVNDSDLYYLPDKYCLARKENTYGNYFLYEDYYKIYDYIDDLSHFSNDSAYEVSEIGFVNSSYRSNIIPNMMPISDFDYELLYGTVGDLVISDEVAKAAYPNLNLDEIVGKNLIMLINYTNYYLPIDGIYDSNIRTLYIKDDYLITNTYNETIEATPLFLGDYEYGIVSEEKPTNPALYPIYVHENSSYNIGDIFDDFEVVGIINNIELENIYYYDGSIPYNNLVFFKEEYYYNDFISSYYNSNFLPIEGKNIIATKKPGKKECIVPEGSTKEVGDTLNYGNQVFTIVGTYKGSFYETKFAVLTNFKDLILADSYSYNYNNLWFEVTDKEAIEEFLTDNYNNYTLVLTYDEAYNTLMQTQREEIMTYGIIVGVMLFIYVIFIFFVMRTKVLNDQYDIAVYRSIGATKVSFYAKYLKETTIQTVFTSLIGYVIATILYILFNNLSQRAFSISIFTINVSSFFIGLAIMVSINLLVSLIPIFVYLQRSPSSLVAKYDM